MSSHPKAVLLIDLHRTYLLSGILNQYFSFTRTRRIIGSQTITIPATTTSHTSRLADLNLLFVAIIWGVNMAVMKMGLNEVDPFLFNAFRLSLSGLVLGICAWLENRKHRLSSQVPVAISGRPNPVRLWATIVGFAVLTGAVYQILFAVGMDRTTAGNTALIMSSMPMWIAMLSFLLLREKLGSAWWGLIIAFLGTIVVTLEKGNINLDSSNQTGNWIVLVAALAWALGSVISRPMLKYISPIRLAFYATVGSLPVHYVMPFLMDSENIGHLLQPSVIVCILYSGVFSTGLAYAMWNYGVQQLGASHASVYQNLVPLVALIAAYVSPLREAIVPMQIVGGIMILLGLFVTRRLRPR